MVDIKRLKYFKGEFLQEKDFTDEQTYHRDMRLRHNRTLHGWGITDSGTPNGGFVVSGQGTKSVTIGPGSAIDASGKEIVLADPVSKDVSTYGPKAIIYVSLQYAEQGTDATQGGNPTDFTRYTEYPNTIVSSTPPATDGTVIPIAKVQLGNDGNIANTDTTIQVLASSKISPASNLQVANLSVTGTVGVGTATPRARLEVAGGAITTNNVLGFSDTQQGPSPVGVYINAPANQSMGLFTNAAERLRIDANGNVGIGTTSPQALMQFKTMTCIQEGAGSQGSPWSNFGSNAYFDGAWKRIDGTKAGVNLHLNAGDKDAGGQEFRFLRIEADGSRLRNLATLGSQISFILESNVGIGTTTPNNKLEILQGNAKVEGEGFGFVVDTGAANRRVGFMKYGNYEGALVAGNGTLVRLGHRTDTNDVTSPLTAAANFRPELVVTPAGNVGIGTSNPVGKLGVAGGAITTDNVLGFSATQQGNSPVGVYINAPANQSMGLFTSAAERVRIDASGKVGIGTTAPGSLLDVADRARIRQGGTGTAGIWLYQSAPQADRAFVGMANDSAVGFWGNTGAGWGLAMDTTNGNVTISGNLGTHGRPADPLTSGWGGGIRTWDIEAEGSLYAANAYTPSGAWKSGSDISLKKNVQSLEGSLDKLLQLRGVTFEWKEPEKQGNLFGTQMGMIAQEVEKVFPNWVGAFPDGTKHLTLSGFEALTVEALRELNDKISVLSQKVESVATQAGITVASETPRGDEPKETPEAEKKRGGPKKK